MKIRSFKRAFFSLSLLRYVCYQRCPEHFGFYQLSTFPSQPDILSSDLFSYKISIGKSAGYSQSICTYQSTALLRKSF